MQVVCEATQATECKVKVAALQCLVRIMSLYYQVRATVINNSRFRYENRLWYFYSYHNSYHFTLQHMEAYMGPALFAITLEAMKSEVDEVSLQGIHSYTCFVIRRIGCSNEISQFIIKQLMYQLFISIII